VQQKSTGVSNQGYTATTGIPCTMVLTVSFVLFPVTGLFCHRHLAGQMPTRLSASVGAPEPHDFTVRLLRHSSDDVPRPSHPAPNVRDDREPPLLWVRDGVKGKGDFSKRPSGIFLQGGLDDPNQLELLGEISFYAQIISKRSSLYNCSGTKTLAGA
jgi:hypothetical protein